MNSACDHDFGCRPSGDQGEWEMVFYHFDTQQPVTLVTDGATVTIRVTKADDGTEVVGDGSGGGVPVTSIDDSGLASYSPALSDVTFAERTDLVIVFTLTRNSAQRRPVICHETILAVS